MKRFFYLFLLVLSFALPLCTGYCADLIMQNAVNAPIVGVAEVPTDESEARLRPSPEEMEAKKNFFSEIMQEFHTSFTTKMKQANELEASEVSVIENPENLSIYTLISLLGRDAGLLTGDKGLGAAHEFDFGAARLVSCMGNLDNRKTLITALAVSLLPDWRLQRPIIPSSESNLWQSEDILYPLRLENNGKQTNSYTEIVMFPIIYELTDATQNFQVSKEITLTACHADTCQTYTRPYSLSVVAGKGYQTDICPAIMNELYVTATPLPDTVKAAAHRNEKGQIQLDLTFPKAISDFNIQIEHPIAFDIQKMFINGTHVNVILKPQSPINPEEIIRFKLLTSIGWYAYDVVPDNKPFTFDKPKQEGNNWFSLGWYFLFFSPFYLLFWSIRPKDQQALSHIVRIAAFSSLIFALLMGMVRYYEIPMYVFFNQPIVLLSQTILIFILIMKPYISVKWIPILLFIMPYPFLYEAGIGYAGGNWLRSYGVSFWWGFCGILPFVLTRCQPIIYQVMTNAQKPIQKIIRLPLSIMFAWMMFNTLLSVVYTRNDYNEEILTQAINENKNVFISVYQSPCLLCALNDYAGKHIYPTDLLQQDNRLIFMRLNQQTPEGQSFLQQYNVLPGQSFNILYGPAQKYGIRIENKYIRPEEWFEYLDMVGGLPKEKKEKVQPLKEEDLPLDYQRAIKALRKMEEFSNRDR